MIPLYILVRIPISPRKTIVITRPNLDESNASLQHPTGRQTFTRKMDSLLLCIDFLFKRSRYLIEPVELEDMLRLLRKIQRFRSSQLHPGCELITANAGFEPLVSRSLLRVASVEFGQQHLSGGLTSVCDVSAGLVRTQVCNRIFRPRINDRPTVLGWQKSRIPILCSIAREPSVVWENNKSREVVVQAPEPVANPCTHARESWQLKTGRMQQGRLAMHPRFSYDIVNKR